MPSASTITSWGIRGLRGSWYSVITTRVLLPVARGSVFSSYVQEPELLLTVAR